MRTKVTFDPDTYALITRHMKEHRLSFDEAVNDAIRRGVSGAEAASRWTFPTYNMGRPRVDLTKALQVVDELDDAELIRKMRERR